MCVLHLLAYPILYIHLESNEFQTTVKSWGVGAFVRTVCPFCLDIALDLLGHHSLTCRNGGDEVAWHNHL